MGNPTPFDVDEIWERIERRVVKDDSTGCWNWTGSKHQGYGKYLFRPDMYYTHRIAYQSLVGDIPEHLELDHLCRNPACCNPEHLEPVTHAENVRRGEVSRNGVRKTA